MALICAEARPNQLQARSAADTAGGAHSPEARRSCAQAEPHTSGPRAYGRLAPSPLQAERNRAGSVRSLYGPSGPVYVPPHPGAVRAPTCAGPERSRFQHLYPRMQTRRLTHGPWLLWKPGRCAAGTPVFITARRRRSSTGGILRRTVFVRFIADSRRCFDCPMAIADFQSVMPPLLRILGDG
jgi:hypothetical protein